MSPDRKVKFRQAITCDYIIFRSLIATITTTHTAVFLNRTIINQFLNKIIWNEKTKLRHIIAISDMLEAHAQQTRESEIPN
jgi:hypothetical protein